MCIRLLCSWRCGVVETTLYILYWEVDSSHRILKRWSTLTFAIVVKLYQDWSNDGDLMMNEWSYMQTVAYVNIRQIEFGCSWWWSLMQLKVSLVAQSWWNKDAGACLWCTLTSIRMGWHSHTPNNLFLIEGDIDIPSLGVHYIYTSARILSVLLINAICVGEIMKWSSEWWFGVAESSTSVTGGWCNESYISPTSHCNTSSWRMDSAISCVTSYQFRCTRWSEEKMRMKWSEEKLRIRCAMKRRWRWTFAKKRRWRRRCQLLWTIWTVY